MKHCLLCPMQLRMHGVQVNEVPKFLLESSTDDSHTLVVPHPKDHSQPLWIPLSLNGVTSYFNTRKPSVEEFEDEHAVISTLTAEGPEWDPSHLAVGYFFVRIVPYFLVHFYLRSCISMFLNLGR